MRADMAARQTQLTALRADIAKGLRDREAAAGVPRAGHRARSDGSRT